MLRPIANPLPLGFLALAGGALMLASAVLLLAPAVAASPGRVVPAAVSATTSVRFALTGVAQLGAGAAWADLGVRRQI